MNSSSSESEKPPSDSNTGISEPQLYLYVISSYVKDDRPWFRVERVSRTFDMQLGHKVDIIIIAGSETIVVMKNRFDFDMEVYRKDIILAATKFMSQTIEALTGWVDRSQQVDRDAILEAVTKLTTKGQA